MTNPQQWHTELYQGMEVHVTALPRNSAGALWDYTVRIAWPGDDAGSDSEIIGKSGDDADYASPEAAVEAGFRKGYQMVDAANR